MTEPLMSIALEVLPALPPLQTPASRLTNFDMILLISRGLKGNLGRNDKVIVRKYLYSANKYLKNGKLLPLMKYFSHTKKEYFEILKNFDDAIMNNDVPTEYLKENGFESLTEVSDVMYEGKDMTRLQNALRYLDTVSAYSSNKLALFTCYEYEWNYDSMENTLLMKSEIYIPLIDYLKWIMKTKPQLHE